MSSSETSRPTPTIPRTIPPGKKDAAWKYGRDGPSKGSVICIFCETEMTGGINRLKYHLARIPGKDIRPCPHVPLEVQQECNAILVGYKEQKELKRKHSDAMACPLGGETRTTYAPSPFPSRGVGSGGTSSSTASVANPGSFFVSRSSPGSQPTLHGMAAWNEEKHKAARKAIAAFWFFSDIPFNVARSPYWRGMVDAIAACGPGFKAPTYHDLRGPLLDEAVQDIQTLLDKQRESWSTSGCTIMSDGWEDGRGRTLINFLVASCDGIVFLRSVDASSIVKNGVRLAALLGSIVDEVGAENVVQIITDNASAYKRAGMILEGKYQTLVWTPCAAHCLDLLLEDIGKLPWVAMVVEKAKQVVKYIYNHSWVLHLMRQYTSGREIARPGITRFATTFVTLQSLFQAQGAMKKMFVGDEWLTEAGARFKGTNEWKSIYDILFEEPFWMAMEEAIKIVEPLVRVLRLVDGDKPPMGYVFEAMERAKQAIARHYNNDKAKYQPLWDLVDRRWTNQLHSSLHAAAYYFNPKFWFGKKCKDYEVMSGLRIAIDRLVADPNVRSAIQTEMQAYKSATGILFNSPECAKAVDTLLPHLWWEDFGSFTPNLQNFAIRILSQPCSASGCERNWSIFEHIHSKRRNRLTQEKLNDLVFVHYNLLLHHKKIAGIDYEAIELDAIDPSSEWIAEDQNQPSGDIDESSDDEDQPLQDPNIPDIVFEDLENLAEELVAKGQEEQRAQGEGPSSSISRAQRELVSYARTKGKRTAKN